MSKIDHRLPSAALDALVFELERDALSYEAQGRIEAAHGVRMSITAIQAARRQSFHDQVARKEKRLAKTIFGKPTQQPS